jgi:hypothetical protein
MKCELVGARKYPNVGKFRKEKKNHRNKMENKYYPIVVTVPQSNKKNIERNKIDIYSICAFRKFGVVQWNIKAAYRCWDTPRCDRTIRD